MIPESVMQEILHVFPLDDLVKLPVSEGVEKLARYITVHSFEALKRENAPDLALLQAACVILTSYVRSGKELEIYDSGGSSGVVVGPKANQELACNHLRLSKALIEFAAQVVKANS